MDTYVVDLPGERERAGHNAADERAGSANGSLSLAHDLSLTVMWPGPTSVVLVVDGTVDSFNAGILGQCLLTQVHRTERRRILLDLGGVTFLGTAGTAMFGLVHTRAATMRSSIDLVAASRAVYRALQVTGFRYCFDSWPDKYARLLVSSRITCTGLQSCFRELINLSQIAKRAQQNQTNRNHSTQLHLQKIVEIAHQCLERAVEVGAAPDGLADTVARTSSATSLEQRSCDVGGITCAVVQILARLAFRLRIRADRASLWDLDTRNQLIDLAYALERARADLYSPPP